MGERKNMDDKFLKVRMEVQQMQAQIMHYFTGYEDVLKSLVARELSEAKLVEAIKGEIGRTLAWKIESAIDDVVKQAVKKSIPLKKKIEKMVDEAVKK